MNLELTEDQAFFRDTTRKFLEAESPLSLAREIWERADGFERDYWAKAAELGWTSAFVPETSGGGSVSGRPVSDAVIVAEEMGRLVAPGPLMPVNVVAWAAGAFLGTGADDLLAGILSGDTVATWALAEPGSAWSGVHPVLGVTATADGADVVLGGVKAYVEAAGQADVFLVTAASANGPLHCLVPADAAGLTVTGGRSLDLTRRFGRLSLEGVRVPRSSVLGPEGDGGRILEGALQRGLALQCAETVGAAERAFEMTVEYGGDRFAFGRPIVSFQALKHRIADMLQWLEFSKAACDGLAAEVDSDGPQAAMLASVAKAYVADHCLDVVDECVQISGGIGVTWEHDVHLFSRRVAVNRALLGTPEQHKERICCLMETEGEAE